MSWNKTAEPGSVFGMRMLVSCMRLFGVRFTRFLSEFPILYYFMSNARARRSSRRYLTRVASFPQGRRSLGGEPGAWTSWMHFRAFGHSLVERASFWAGMGAGFRVEFPMRPELLRLAEQKRGAILIGSHLGSIDVLRALVTKKSTPVNFLMFRSDAQKFNAVLKSVDPGLGLRAIHVDHGSIQYMLDLQAAVARGELVAILGDRAELASERRTARATFLGAEASFPLGPLWTAYLLECPVYLLFALKRGPDSYEICLEPFAERILLDRKHRDRDLRAWLERYVRRLEAHCLSTPLQWFNFYDFWRSEAAGAHGAPAGAASAMAARVFQGNGAGPA